MKKVMSWISLYLVGLIWFAAASLFVLFAVFNPDTIKSTLEQNNAYEKIVPAALEETRKNYKPTDGSQIPLENPESEQAIQKAFPASDLQNKSETIIDSVFAWLEGKTATPQFRLDFTNNKQVLATELGAYAEQRAAGLPPCTLQDLEAARNSDVFSIKCLPPGISPAQAGREAAQRVANDETFLKNTVITSEDFKSSDNDLSDAQVSFEPVRELYQNKTLLSWAVPTLIILLVVVGLYLAPDRQRAIKRLARLMIVSAISLGIIAAILSFLGRRFVSSIAPDKVSGDIAMPLISDLLGQASLVYLWFAIISLALSIGLFATLKGLLPKNLKT